MPGSFIRTVESPRPLELIARLLLASTLVLSLSNAFGRALVEPLVPVFTAVITSVDSDFTILSADIAQDGPNKAIRFRANLAHPIEIGGKTVYPFGWGPVPNGEFQVTITVGGVLQYCAIMMIVVFAWPVVLRREYGLRVVIAAPLSVALLFIYVPLNVLGELRNGIHVEWDPGGLQPLMVWSRFLAGGGGLALGMVGAGLAIGVAARSR